MTGQASVAGNLAYAIPGLVAYFAGGALSALFLRESEHVVKRLLFGAALIVAGGALIGAFR